MSDENIDRDTASQAYATRLQARGSVWWKRLLDVQAPYRWNVRRCHLRRTLDIGCGIGRNLSYLDADSVGVDHNPASIQVARNRGLKACTVVEWQQSPWRQPEQFDSLLVAHVIEHMDATSAESLMRNYLPYLKPGGQVLFICPQERGYASDTTHVRFTTDNDLTELARDLGLMIERSYSFPFPRFAGRAFTYNEFCVLATKPF